MPAFVKALHLLRMSAGHMGSGRFTANKCDAGGLTHPHALLAKPDAGEARTAAAAARIAAGFCCESFIFSSTWRDAQLRQRRKELSKR